MSGHDAPGVVAAWHLTAGATAPDPPGFLGDESHAVFGAMIRLLAHAGCPVEGHVTRVEGRRLHWLAAGAGPPLVLLHGGSGGGANWYAVLGALATRHRVLALDLPGFGFSDPAALAAPLGAHGARLVAAWLDAAGVGRAAFMGTSYGALAALRLAADDPARVTKLVLLDPVGAAPAVSWLVRAAALPALAPLLAPRSRRAFEAVFRWLMVADASAIPADQRRDLLAWLWAAERAGAGRTVARSLRIFAGLTGQREVPSREELRGVRAPVLVLWGEHDRFVPASGAGALAGRLPDARWEVLAGAGHSPNWETPGALLAAVQPFLEGPGEHVDVG